MVQNRQVTLLGDSILKGIQVDLGDRRYRTHNEINVEALESEFQLSIHNDAHFGATVRKGSRLLDRMLARKLPCDMMVMDFGGNDCDFRWKEIAEDPTGDHQPNVPLPEFVELYREMIRRVRSHGIPPISWRGCSSTSSACTRKKASPCSTAPRRARAFWSRTCSRPCS